MKIKRTRSTYGTYQMDRADLRNIKIPNWIAVSAVLNAWAQYRLYADRVRYQDDLLIRIEIGEVITSEPEIAEYLGITRMAVRKVLKQMEQDDYIKIITDKRSQEPDDSSSRGWSYGPLVAIPRNSPNGTIYQLQSGYLAKQRGPEAAKPKNKLPPPPAERPGPRPPQAPTEPKQAATD